MGRSGEVRCSKVEKVAPDDDSHVIGCRWRVGIRGRSGFKLVNLQHFHTLMVFTFCTNMQENSIKTNFFTPVLTQSLFFPPCC